VPTTNTTVTDDALDASPVTFTAEHGILALERHREIERALAAFPRVVPDLPHPSTAGRWVQTVLCSHRPGRCRLIAFAGGTLVAVGLAVLTPPGPVMLVTVVGVAVFALEFGLTERHIGQRSTAGPQR